MGGRHYLAAKLGADDAELERRVGATDGLSLAVCVEPVISVRCLGTGSKRRWSCSGERCAGACRRDEPRLAPFTDIEPRLNELLREFGTPSTRPSAQYPFWRLQGDGLWEVEAPVDLTPRNSNTDPKVTELLWSKVGA